MFSVTKIEMGPSYHLLYFMGMELSIELPNDGALDRNVLAVALFHGRPYKKYDSAQAS